MAIPIRLLSLVFAFLSLLSSFEAFATHLRAGEITAKRLSCSSLTFEITITVFIDTESGVQFGNDYLYFGDGGKILVPITTTIRRPDLGLNMGIATFTTQYTYVGYQEYKISYSQPNRNEHVINMFKSIDTKFYLETTIYLDPFLSCDVNLPKLLVPPIDRACKGVAFFHNPGAYDLDGDSLSFEMNVPKQATDRPVFDYADPNDRKFYLNFEFAREDKMGPPTFSINPQDGTLKWDSPGAIGEYNIAFLIVSWRKDRTGQWRKMSYMTRDMQIIVDDCDNQRPDLILPKDLCVTAGTVIKETIFGIDPENDKVKIEAFSEIFNLFVSPAIYKPNPATLKPSAPPAELHFEWNTQCDHVKDQYYYVVFKITDDPPHGTKLVTFKIWRIKVVAPAPTWNDAELNLSTRTATLTWDNYTCENASTMQVWRKVDGFPFSPDNCQTGMPAFLGYSLVATVPMKEASTRQPVDHFVDTNEGKGLAPGAKYCYRLVAVFPDPKGGESYVSSDTCLVPILADAPVITHVTVETTDSKDGTIRISWRSPFEISRAQFPGPYEYAVYRASGFAGNDFIGITPLDRIKDTTFVDSFINTKDAVFDYRIVLYSNTASDRLTWTAIDTSATASSVRLDAKPFSDKITLNWKAEVPWSNASERFPYHLIFRSTGDQDHFTLIDSISTVHNDFTYSDAGQYQHTPLDKDQTYCYRVLTRGVYGNPLIHEPLENFSQIICVKQDDLARPCTPVLSLTAVDCDEIFASSQCQVRDFTNRIYWSTECSEKVSGYNIYVSANPEKEFVLLAENVKEDFYVDKNLTSFARCYKITAVDAQGYESEKSEMVCNDNCPYFELPNVFTPNGDGCNEYFSAYGPFNFLNSHAPESCESGTANYSKCLRFVKKVSFSVFNRWGKEVYTFKSGSGENSTYINWDGRDNDGRWLSSGIYYYAAHVAFDVMDIHKQQQTYKGWIHLVR
jgi:hypothetical protein